jgi:hypothetical protein
MRIYLDIDGTILTGNGLAHGAKDFILSAVANHDVRWLTTHSRGDPAPALRYLRQFVDDETFAALERIQPTSWDVLKTEALDPDDPDWIWLDDAPLATEIAWLEEHDRLASWIRIDLAEDPEALVGFFDVL